MRAQRRVQAVSTLAQRLGSFWRGSTAAPPRAPAAPGNVGAEVAERLPLIRLRGITKTYGQGQAAFKALKGVDLSSALGGVLDTLTRDGPPPARWPQNGAQAPWT